MQWTVNNNLKPGTAIIYLYLEGYGHIKIENQRSGIEQLDLSALQYWQNISSREEEAEEEYPGLTLATIMVEKFGGYLEKVECGMPKS